MIWRGLSLLTVSVYGRELVCTYTAQGTFKVLGEILKRGAGGNALVGSTYGGIVLPAADIAYVFLHNGIC